jgi:hypothetical protein
MKRKEELSTQKTKPYNSHSKVASPTKKEFFPLYRFLFL